MTTTTTAPAAAVSGSGALGKVTAISGDVIHFAPAGTNYTLHLLAPRFSGTVGGAPVRGMIRVTARKIWTVPSGGNFVAPITGQPRTIQGRVRSIEPGRIVVHAGTNFVVAVPDNDTVCDLADGAIAVGRMVNVTALPGATFEM